MFRNDAQGADLVAEGVSAAKLNTKVVLDCH